MGVGGSLRVNVTVAGVQSSLDFVTDFIGLGLPCSQTDDWDLVASVEGESLPL